LPKVATTNPPNLPGEMHPDPAFVPRLRKGQRADFPTGNKMKPTNPHAHTYVSGTGVERHREENLIDGATRGCGPLHIFGTAWLCVEDATCEVKSLGCGVQSVDCKMSSVRCM
jgi:hypothetical protein